MSTAGRTPTLPDVCPWSRGRPRPDATAVCINDFGMVCCDMWTWRDQENAHGDCLEQWLRHNTCNGAPMDACVMERLLQLVLFSLCDYPAL